MKSGIYKITNTTDNKVYVGQAENLGTRYGRHLYRIKRKEHHNEHLQRSFDKYGEDKFIYEILEEIEDLSILDSREKHWIDHYGGINSDNTYNFKDPLLNEHNDYVRNKMSKSSLGENNPNYGNKWTDEQRKKMSESRKGKSWEELYGKKKANEMKENSAEAQKGRKHSEETLNKIRKANIGEKNPAHGKGDRQKGEKNPMYGKPVKHRRSVVQFDKEGNKIKEYDFINQVVEDGFNAGNVAMAAKGKLKSSGGYVWKYKEEN
jgi:group I intron endonuclease